MTKDAENKFSILMHSFFAVVLTSGPTLLPSMMVACYKTCVRACMYVCDNSQCAATTNGRSISNVILFSFSCSSTQIGPFFNHQRPYPSFLRSNIQGDNHDNLAVCDR